MHCVSLVYIDAVFFGTYCGLNVHRGMKRKHVEDDAGIKQDSNDIRCSSLKEAVKFAKQNNLLGVICNAQTLVSCPFSFMFTCFNMYHRYKCLL